MNIVLKTLLVDDHPVFRQGLRQVITSEPNFHVVAEAAGGLACLDLVVKCKVDLLVLDIGLPDLNGLEIVRRLQANRSNVKVVILTMHAEEELFNKALNLDVKGYLLKDNAPTEIINCLKAVARGDYYLTPSMSGAMLRRRHRAAALDSSKHGLGKLTTAERRLLPLIATNRTSRQIARELCISHRTVEAHRANICMKLDLHGSNCLLQFAIEHQSEF